MAKKKVTSPRQKAQYGNYKITNKYEKNRKRRLNRHLKKHPNDATAERALSSIQYRRKTPRNENKTISLSSLCFNALNIRTENNIPSYKKQLIHVRKSNKLLKGM